MNMETMPIERDVHMSKNGSTVWNNIETLESHNSRFSDLIANLEEKLATVLLPDYSEKANLELDPEPAVPEMSLLGNKLCDLQTAYYIRLRRLDRLIERIEL